jgi:cytochrome oxidase Cu insertion factor (SCO1/SenC/PrrC family)/copper(I)-binding protein
MASMLRLIMIATAVLLPLATMSAAAAEEGGPKIDRAWARATPGAANTGAVYFRIESPIDDRLIGLASPVARKAELHTHVEENGVMQMREVEGGLAVPADQRVELKAGGLLHVMLIDLKKPLKVGNRFPLTLTFEKAGTRDVTVQVERLGAMGPTDDPLPPKEASAEIGGPFTLVDQDGRTVTDTQFRGKWLLVYFGYTHCPDACPTALNDMAEALSELDPAKRDNVQPIFITVDPERDTPAVMKDYVGAFGEANIIGLSGTQKQVSAAETAYRIHAQRHDRKDGDYTMSHTSAIHIIDPDGRFVGMAQPERIAERLAQLVP